MGAFQNNLYAVAQSVEEPARSLKDAIDRHAEELSRATWVLAGTTIILAFSTVCLFLTTLMGLLRQMRMLG